MNDLHSHALSDIFKRTYQNWRAVHLVHVKLNLLQKDIWIQSSEIKFWFPMLGTHLHPGFENFQWVWGILRLSDGMSIVVQSSKTEHRSLGVTGTNICCFLWPKHREAKPLPSGVWHAIPTQEVTITQLSKRKLRPLVFRSVWATSLSVCCKQYQ